MVIAVGEALIDFISTPVADGPESRELFRPVPGGSPYNTAIALSRLGVKTSYMSRISRDLFGEMLLDHLAANGVGVSLVKRTDDPSTLAFVRKNRDGHPEYAFFTNGSADRNLDDADFPTDLSPQVECITCGSISLVAEPSGSVIERFVLRESSSRTIVFDPNIRRSLIVDAAAYRKRVEAIASVATIVKTSDEDLDWIVGRDGVRNGKCDFHADAARLLDLGARMVVVTRGASGSVAVLPGRTIAVDAVEPSPGGDTVGAGDTYGAALVSWLDRRKLLAAESITRLDDGEVRSMLEYASRAAGITCSREGCDPPRFAELAGT
jgi:fructokinase